MGTSTRYQGHKKADAYSIIHGPYSFFNSEELIQASTSWMSVNRQLGGFVSNGDYKLLHSLIKKAIKAFGGREVIIRLLFPGINEFYEIMMTINSLKLVGENLISIFKGEKITASTMIELMVEITKRIDIQGATKYDGINRKALLTLIQQMVTQNKEDKSKSYQELITGTKIAQDFVTVHFYEYFMNDFMHRFEKDTTHNTSEINENLDKFKRYIRKNVESVEIDKQVESLKPEELQAYYRNVICKMEGEKT